MSSSDDDSSSDSSSSGSSSEEEKSGGEKSPMPIVKKESTRKRNRSEDFDRERERKKRHMDRGDRDRDRERRRRMHRSRSRERTRRSDYQRRRRRQRSESVDDHEDELQGQPPSPSPPAVLKLMKERRQEKSKKQQHVRAKRDKIKKEKRARHEIVELFVAAMPSLTRVGRRLYIGNLSANMKMDEIDIKKMFADLCVQKNIRTKDPIFSVWLSNEKNFCFLEFRKARDADIAIDTFGDYVTPNGRNIRVGRPKNWEDLEPDFLKDFVLDGPPPKIPRKFNILEHYPKAVLEFHTSSYDENKPWQNYNSKNNFNNNFNNSWNNHDNRFNRNNRRFTEEEDEKVIMLPLPGKGSFQAQRENPNATRVVVLESGSFSRSALRNESRTVLIKDVRQECRKYGKILDVKVPREPEEDRGRIFVKFNVIDDAISAKKVLKNMKFSGKRVHVHFYKEELFDKNTLDGRAGIIQES